MGTRTDAVLAGFQAAAANQIATQAADRAAIDAKYDGVRAEQQAMIERHNAEANASNVSFQKKLDAAIKADQAAEASNTVTMRW